MTLAPATEVIPFQVDSGGDARIGGTAEGVRKQNKSRFGSQGVRYCLLACCTGRGQ